MLHIIFFNVILIFVKEQLVQRREKRDVELIWDDSSDPCDHNDD